MTQETSGQLQSKGNSWIDVPYLSPDKGSRFLPAAPTGKVWQFNPEDVWASESEGFAQWHLVKDPDNKKRTKEEDTRKDLNQKNNRRNKENQSDRRNKETNPVADVPGIQDWGIDEQIRAAQENDLTRRAQEASLFDDVLQRMSISNQSPFNTYASANPSEWENILKDWTV
jgi:hypothetical protein